MQAFVPAIYWNDVDCYYWAAAVRLPSGHWCEFKVSKDGQKWKPRIIPTFQEYKEMKERVSLQAEEREKWLQEQRRKREMEKEIGASIRTCVRGLKALDCTIHKNERGEITNEIKGFFRKWNHHRRLPEI